MVENYEKFLNQKRKVLPEDNNLRISFEDANKNELLKLERISLMLKKIACGKFDLNSYRSVKNMKIDENNVFLSKSAQMNRRYLNQISLFPENTSVEYDKGENLSNKKHDRYNVSKSYHFSNEYAKHKSNSDLKPSKQNKENKCNKKLLEVTHLENVFISPKRSKHKRRKDRNDVSLSSTFECKRSTLKVPPQLNYVHHDILSIPSENTFENISKVSIDFDASMKIKRKSRNKVFKFVHQNDESENEIHKYDSSNDFDDEKTQQQNVEDSLEYEHNSSKSSLDAENSLLLRKNNVAQEMEESDQLLLRRMEKKLEEYTRNLRSSQYTAILSRNSKEHRYLNSDFKDETIPGRSSEKVDHEHFNNKSSKNEDKYDVLYEKSFSSKQNIEEPSDESNEEEENDQKLENVSPKDDNETVEQIYHDCSEVGDQVDLSSDEEKQSKYSEDSFESTPLTDDGSVKSTDKERESQIQPLESDDGRTTENDDEIVLKPPGSTTETISQSVKHSSKISSHSGSNDLSQVTSAQKKIDEDSNLEDRLAIHDPSKNRIEIIYSKNPQDMYNKSTKEKIEPQTIDQDHSDEIEIRAPTYVSRSVQTQMISLGDEISILNLINPSQKVNKWTSVNVSPSDEIKILDLNLTLEKVDKSTSANIFACSKTTVLDIIPPLEQVDKGITAFLSPCNDVQDIIPPLEKVDKGITAFLSPCNDVQDKSVQVHSGQMDKQTNSISLSLLSLDTQLDTPSVVFHSSNDGNNKSTEPGEVKSLLANEDSDGEATLADFYSDNEKSYLDAKEEFGSHSEKNTTNDSIETKTSLSEETSRRFGDRRPVSVSQYSNVSKDDLKVVTADQHFSQGEILNLKRENISRLKIENDILRSRLAPLRNLSVFIRPQINLPQQNLSSENQHHFLSDKSGAIPKIKKDRLNENKVLFKSFKEKEKLKTVSLSDYLLYKK